MAQAGRYRQAPIQSRDRWSRCTTNNPNAGPGSLGLRLFSLLSRRLADLTLWQIRRPRILVLIEGCLQVFSRGCRLAAQRRSFHWPLLPWIGCQVEKLSPAIELVLVIEGKLLQRLAARRVPAINPLPRIAFLAFDLWQKAAAVNFSSRRG